ncbi:MAG: ABC transporter permease, partial [Acidimicrobiia bacterium]
MIKTAFKSVLAHKVRLLLTAVAIVLGVSLVTGTFIFTDTITRQFDTLLDDIYSGTDVSVRADAGEFAAGSAPFPADVLDIVEQVEGVGVAEGGVASVTSQVLDKNGDPIGGQGPPTLGFSWGDTQALNPMRIKDGQGAPPAGPGQVALDANTVRGAGFELGDLVTVVGFDGPDEFELVGIASFGDQDSLLGATIVLFELEEAQRVFGFDDELSGISVQAEAGVAAATLAEDISAVLPTGVEAVTGQTEQSEQAADINEGLGFLTVGLLAFAGVSVFVGAFIIQNTFRIIIAQRTRELALLRAIGATGRQVRWMVMVEAFFVGLVGSIVGIGVGFVMAVGIRGLMNAVGLSIPPGSLLLLPRTVIVGLAVGLLLTLASALLPARKASRVPPVAALLVDASRTPRRSLRTRALAGSAVTGLGVAMLLFGLFSDVANAIIYVGIGAAVSFIGVSILAPLAAKPLANVIGWPLPRLFGVAGQLARENTKRKPRRTASTASALMIGVALVAFFTVFASSTKASVSETVFELFPADLTFQSTNRQDPALPDPMSPSLAEELETYDALEVVSALQFGRVEIDSVTEVVGAFDPDTIEEVFSIDANGDAVSLLAELDSMIVATKLLEANGWKIGDTVPVDFVKSGQVAVVIVGSYEVDDFFNIYFSTATYIENFRYLGDGVVYANTSEGVTLDEAQVAIAPTI